MARPRKVARESLSGWGERRARLRDALHPAQKDVFDDLSKYLALLVGRGGGKTTIIESRLCDRMGSVNRARCLYVATTRDQAIELLWYPLKELVDALEIRANFEEVRLRCEFIDQGSSLRLVGADDKRQIEKYRGQPFHEVWVDEAGSYPTELLEHLIDRIIGPRLGDFDGVLGLAGTPTHTLKGPFYEATRPGAEGKIWSVHRWTLREGAKHVPTLQRLWTRALADKEKKGWSDENPVWRREYLGQWAADDTMRVFKYRPHLESGEAWNQWDPPRDEMGFARLPPGPDGKPRTDWIYIYGADLGSKDPFAIAIFAYSPTDLSKTLYHVFEFEKRDMYPRKIAEVHLGEALDHDHPGGLIGRTDWPAGMVMDRDGAGDQIIAELANVYGINYEAAEKKNYVDAVEIMNGDLIDGRMKILKGSQLEEQMLNLQWEVDEWGLVKKPRGERDDCADAAVYARRKAGHLFAEEERKPAPRAPGPAWLVEDREKRLKRENEEAPPLPEPRKVGEFRDLLDDGDFDRYDGWD